MGDGKMPEASPVRPDHVLPSIADPEGLRAAYRNS